MMNCNATLATSWATLMSKPVISYFWLLAVCFFLLPAALVACTPTDDSWARVQNSGVLLVGLDPTFPPFENADTGELHGLDVDLAYALGQELGLTVEFRYLGYDGLYDALATRQVDVLLSALVIDMTKTRDFAYSQPYFDAGQLLVVREEDAEQIKGVADLAGRLLAVELGSEGHVQGTQWARQVPNLTIRSLPTAVDALWLVAQGEVDTAVVDHTTARLYRQNAPHLHLSPNPLTAEPYALVVRIDDQTLLEQLNLALAQLDTSGQLNQIQHRWLDQPHD